MGPQWSGEVWGCADLEEKGGRAPEALVGLLQACLWACQATRCLDVPTPLTHLLWFCPLGAPAPPVYARHTQHTTPSPRSNQKAPQTRATKALQIRHLGMAACLMIACWHHLKAQSLNQLLTNYLHRSLTLCFSLRWCPLALGCRAIHRPSSQLKLPSRGRGSCSRALPLSPPPTGLICVPSALPLPLLDLLRSNIFSTLTRTILLEPHGAIHLHHLPLGFVPWSPLSPRHHAASPSTNPSLALARRGISTNLGQRAEALCWEE